MASGMDSELVRIVTIPDTGDHRGGSFALPDGWNRFLPNLVDIHVTMIRPGQVRGNHYHARHKEILLVIYRDEWSFYWDSGAGTAIQERVFPGTGGVLIAVMPLASHAVFNSGKRDLFVAGLSDARHDPNRPDAFPRPVAPGKR